MTKKKDVLETTADTIENHLAEFQPLLDDINIPEDQRREFVEMLWSIMVQFVALGFGADTASQAIATHIANTLNDEPSALSDVFAVSQKRISETDIETRPL